MNILLAFCLLLVMISLIMAMNSVTRLERLRQHNDLMQKELDKLRKDYLQMQEHLMATAPVAEIETPAAKPQPESPPAKPEDVLQEQLRQLQAILEAYRRQHSGRFPDSLQMLVDFANRQGLQKTIENPYTGARNPLVSEDVCLDITHEPTDEGLPEFAGRLLFQANFGPRSQIAGYTLAAFDSQGLLLKREDGEVLTLTHVA
ncbi:MAG: hypothetical protein CVV27_11660 [Candidatus Melainabacteria bacterium HGW-Melainabacteria-1]|nr:MAG: hypothetical protein CVV27_11660 [Candidatus Melainabacteria bacterium HGW-Melainabacteria-1]